MSESVLDRALRDLGVHLAWPPGADLSARVVSEIEHVVPLRPRRRARRVALLAAAALLVLTGLLAVSPGLRAAVFELLGIRGAEVEVHETIAPPTGEAFIGQALLGDVVSLEEAETELGFPISLPRGLGRGEGPFLLRDGITPIASVVYRDGVLVFSQFRAKLEQATVRKFAQVGQVRRVSVDGAAGIWVEGPHAVLVQIPSGNLAEVEPFLSASSLLWTIDGVTFRLEGAIDLDEALRIARTVRL